MITLKLDKPNEKQALALKARRKYIGYGGARGGGKSWFVRTKSILLALKYSGIKVLIVRRTYPELINNHINVLTMQLAGIAKYNRSEKVFKFPNGAMIKGDYCSSDADLSHFQGSEWDVIFLEEATNFTEYQIKTIIACLRGTNGLPKHVFFTMNPGGVGHQYIKRIFIDRRYEDGEDPNDFEFIQALVQDNVALMSAQPDYIKQLEALPPKIREAWLNGSWDVYEGQFFEEFADRPEYYLDRTWTHVIEPFEIPSDWTCMRVFDFGYNRPFACEWIFMNPDGVMFVALELYGCTKTPNEGVKWSPTQIFQEIHRIECEHRWLKGRNIQGVADPAIWNAEYGKSIAEVAADNQVYFSKGDHERLAGWMQMHYRLAFDENGYAMMYFFKNCKGAIRTLPTLVYDEHKPEDIDTEGEDHIADALRYGCMARMIKPRIRVTPDKYNETPQAMFLDIPKEDIIARPKKQRMEVISGGNEEEN